MAAGGDQSAPARQPSVRSRVADHAVGALLLRLVASVLLAAATMELAYLGLLVTHAPAVISLLVEPLSLLWMPGDLLAMLLALGHDVDTRGILVCSAVFYTVLFFFCLLRCIPSRHRKP